MDLLQWLDTHELTDAAFAALVGCDQTTINRAKRGITMPGAVLLSRITVATDGAVQASDLLDAFVTKHSDEVDAPRYAEALLKRAEAIATAALHSTQPQPASA